MSVKFTREAQHAAGASHEPKSRSRTEVNIQEASPVKSAVRLALPLLILLGMIPPALGMTEFRGLYVDAFHPGIKTHEEVTQMVSAAKAANFNALIVQVRKRGDAYYNSKIEPKASDIATDYDPLADVVKQAHAAGLEVHAWLTVYEVSNKLYNLGSAHVSIAHPEWLMKNSSGEAILTRGAMCLDPGIPQVQQHLLCVIMDVARGYAVDGIHLDKIVYPDTSCGYNEISLTRFNQQFGRAGSPSNDDSEWVQWRCDQVTGLVRAAQQAIAAIRPAVKLSVAVTSDAPESSASVSLQEWSTWVSEGAVDFVVPMMFFDKDWMECHARNAVRSAHDRAVYIGVGTYQLSPEMARKHISDIRAAGGKGMVAYSYHYLGPNSVGASVKLSDLATDVFSETASPPAMAWKESEGGAD